MLYGCLEATSASTTARPDKREDNSSSVTACRCRERVDGYNVLLTLFSSGTSD